MARRGHRWLSRGVLAGVLAAAAFAPGQASGAPSTGCGAARCPATGLVLWTHQLPGTWAAATTLLGTVPAQPGGGQAYAAAGSSVAAVGFGMSVYGFSARTGDPLWVTALAGFAAGSQIVSVRAWPGAVTVGVAPGPGSGPQPGTAASQNSQSSQSTVLLSAAAGRRLRVFPAAPFGGAVAADGRSTVVLGPGTVTRYRDAAKRAVWSRDTGQAGQDWRSDGGHLYLAVAPRGSLGGPASGLREISLRSGMERIVRPPGGSFDGRLAAVLRGIALFSGPDGASAYSTTTGRLLWRRPGAVPESVDVPRGVFYLTIGGALAGVQPRSGRVMARVPGADGSGSSGVYGVRGGVALGLDLGAAGRVWGYDVAAQRVIWTTRTLPWPHYFVDLSGIGGSTGPASRTVLLAVCPQRVTASRQYYCQDPELVLIRR